ncbi:MAG: arginine--tRNA ligase, partial [Firmicutes bacterium]|nr:arginine--tRNA ligase [Bacillota bacterium]
MVAEALLPHLEGAVPYVQSVETAGPGFLNFRLDDGWLDQVLPEIEAVGTSYGNNDGGATVSGSAGGESGDLDGGNGLGDAGDLDGGSAGGERGEAGEKVLLEFVSANPTGPMHMGNARGAALGDSLARILKAAGRLVSREFWINDAGNQIHNYALSLEARYLQAA